MCYINTVKTLHCNKIIVTLHYSIILVPVKKKEILHFCPIEFTHVVVTLTVSTRKAAADDMLICAIFC